MPVTGNLSIPRTDLDANLMQSRATSNWIAPLIYPLFEVPDITGRIGVTPLERMFNTIPSDKRAADGTYQRVASKFSDDSYSTEERGLEEVIDDRKARVYGSIFNFEVSTSIFLQEMIRRQLELDVKDSVHDAGVFTGASNTLAVNTAWNNAASGKPIDDVATGKQKIYEKCGLIADTLQISQRTHWDLSRSDQILERLKYTSAPEGVLNLGVLAAALGVGRVVVGNAVRNTADQGQTATLASIWPNDAASLMVTAGPDIASPGLGRILFYRETPGEGDVYVETYRDETRRSDVLRVRNERQVKRWSAIFGFRFTGVN